jgi:predicted nuclease of restriction endonuclease-like (RecB) superfamily
MRKFAQMYPDANCAAAAAQLPWGHTMVLLDKLKNNAQRLWYTHEAIENGWSRASLTMWIESDLYSRQGKAVTNFKTTLPELYSDLAEQTLKDPYNFNFLTIDKRTREREIESELMTHVQKFLLELGQGFAFIARQYHLEIGDEDFYIDMLFYHLDLRCFVVIELKTTTFNARDLGQINMYLSAVDDLVRRPGDKPTIGLLLCKSKNNYTAEYALRDINKPIGISSYTTKLVESLPKEFKDKLPTIEEIETELGKDGNNTDHKK